MTWQDVLAVRASSLIDRDATRAFVEPFYSAYQARSAPCTAQVVSPESSKDWAVQFVAKH